MMCGFTLKESKNYRAHRITGTGTCQFGRGARLRWFCHVECRDRANLCMLMDTVGTRWKGHLNKIWRNCINDDMQDLGLRGCSR